MTRKPSDVKSMSAEYLPIAECVEEDCDWTFEPSRYSLPTDTKKRAKTHVQLTGHWVHVTKRTVTAYYVTDPASTEKVPEL